MSTHRQTVTTRTTPIRPKVSRFLPASSSSTSTRSSLKTEDWTTRNPVSSSRFLTHSTTTAPSRRAAATAEFLSQHVERDRDHYKEQARKADDLISKLQDLVRYDVGEPRFFGPEISTRTPILSEDLLTKVTHIHEGYYCAKEELEALWMEFMSLQRENRGTTKVDMLHRERAENDFKSARNGITANLNKMDEMSDEESCESLDSNGYEINRNDLKSLVEWQNRKILQLKRERNAINAKLEAEKAEMEQFKKDMLLSVRVAEQFRKEAEHEAKMLRLEVEKLAANVSPVANHLIINHVSEPSSERGIKSTKGELPIWVLLKHEKPLGSRRNAFLEWCKDRVSPYRIEVQNFSSHWNDGRAFAALLHSFNSTYMHPDRMSRSTARSNVEYILNVAVRLKVPDEYILSPSRLLREKPSWQDVMDFTAQLVSALLRTQAKSGAF